MFQWRDRATQEIVAEFDYARLGGETEYPFVIQLEQHRTVYAALEAAKRYSLFTIHRPVQVMSVSQDADGVYAEVRHEDGTKRSIAAAICLVATAGAASSGRPPVYRSRASLGPSVSTS